MRGKTIESIRALEGKLFRVKETKLFIDKIRIESFARKKKYNREFLTKNILASVCLIMSRNVTTKISEAQCVTPKTPLYIQPRFLDFVDPLNLATIKPHTTNNGPSSCRGPILSASHFSA